jgi:L-rhamnose-H+ transport protein
METSIFYGILVTTLGGLIMGLSPTPLKFMQQFKYEQFGFISMLVALLIIPWGITFIYCPNLRSVLSEIDKGLLLRANLFSLCWGIAQILAMLCFLRIGVSLTYGILCSLGAGVGVIVPMIFKATGIFSEAPNLLSKAGMAVLAGVVVMILGVYYASLAGFKREKLQQTDQPENSGTKSGSFGVSLVMVITAGVLSTGWGFAFAYSQGPIVKILTEHGVADFPSKIIIWAFVLFGAALINVLYPAYLLTRNKSWNLIMKNGREILLSIGYGLLFFIPSVMLGKGMLMLGVLGASVGWGITQGSLILGGQILGFASGEWRGVTGKPRQYIYIAIVVLIISMVIMAFGNFFAQR